MASSLEKRITNLECRHAEPYRIIVRFHDDGEPPAKDDDENNLVINLTWEGDDESQYRRSERGTFGDAGKR